MVEPHVPAERKNDSAWKHGTTDQRAPWDHLGTIFDQNRKLLSRRWEIHLWSILLLEAGLHSKLYTATKCRLPCVYIHLYTHRRMYEYMYLTFPNNCSAPNEFREAHKLGRRKAPGAHT